MALKINIKNLIAAGFESGQIGFKDSNGEMAGITGTLSNGSVASMHTWAGVKTANVQIPDDTVEPITGDNTVLGTFTFPSNAARSFEFTVGQLDLDIVNKSQGTNIYTMASYYDTLLGDVLDRDYMDAVVWLRADAKIKDSGKEGSGYFNLVFPNAQATWLGTSLNEQAAMTQNFRLTINPFTRDLVGRSLESNGYGKTEAHFLFWASERRMTLNTYKHDGAASSFVLSRVPYTDTNGKIRAGIFRTNPNGVNGQEVTTSAAIAAATKTVTISGISPLASGHYLNAIFEY